METTEALAPSVEEALADYMGSGYYIARQMFSQEEVDAIRNAFMEENRDGPVPGLSEISPTHFGDYTSQDPLRFYPRMMMPHMHPDKEVGQIALKYVVDPRLHPLLVAFMNDEPVVAQTMFYFKPPKARGQDLHQDNYYLLVKPETCMAAWIAIDDADFENGGMMVVPGSQDLEVVCPEVADSATSFTVDYVAPPAGMEVLHVDLRAGDVLFFNGSLIHGSTPNLSETRFRRALICHYFPAGSSQVTTYCRGHMQMFDGSFIETPEATGGGPCGTTQAGPH